MSVNPEQRVSPPGTDALTPLAMQVTAGTPGAMETLFEELYPRVLRYSRGRLGRQETVIGSADQTSY